MNRLDKLIVLKTIADESNICGVIGDEGEALTKGETLAALLAGAFADAEEGTVCGKCHVVKVKPMNGRDFRETLAYAFREARESFCQQNISNRILANMIGVSIVTTGRNPSSTDQEGWSRTSKARMLNVRLSGSGSDVQCNFVDDEGNTDNDVEFVFGELIITAREEPAEEE